MTCQQNTDNKLFLSIIFCRFKSFNFQSMFLGELIKVEEVKNRSEVEIMAAILKSAVANWQYQTSIMQDAGVSHSQITRFLSKAIKNGLIDESDITRMYRTSQKGLVYLNKYSHLIELFPSVLDLPDTKHSVDSKNLNVELNS
jgi:predicted transcriptional regulator